MVSYCCKQFLRLLAEDGSDSSSTNSDHELGLAKAIDGIAQDMETDLESFKAKKEKHQEYENECREKLSTKETEMTSEATKTDEDASTVETKISSLGLDHKFQEEPTEEVRELSYQRKLTVLYELLSACLADIRDDDKKCARKRKGYDARHRVALRLLATWLDIKWIKVVCISKLYSCILFLST